MERLFKVVVRFSCILISLMGAAVCHAQESGTVMKLAAILWSPHLLSNPQLRFVADHFDVLALSDCKACLPKASDFKFYNPSMEIFGYLNARQLIPNSSRYGECDPDEEFFAHDAHGDRIRNTCFNQMLMNIFYYPAWKDKLIEWAGEMPREIDGVFMDDAGPTLYFPCFSGLPRNYDPNEYALEMKNLLSAVSRHTPVVFNGLKEGLKYNNYLDGLEGGLLEGFIFTRNNQWVKTDTVSQDIDAMIQARKKKKRVFVTVKAYMNDINNRIFALSCYLLGASDYSYYNFVDINYEFSSYPQYYPEYDIHLGLPLKSPDKVTDMIDSTTRLAIRYFQNGVVGVNPWPYDIKVLLPKVYYKVVPRGGGIVSYDGTSNGYLYYERVYGYMVIPRQSAVILLNRF